MPGGLCLVKTSSLQVLTQEPWAWQVAFLISKAMVSNAWEPRNAYQGATSQNHPQLDRRASGRCLPCTLKALLCEGHWGELEGTQPSLTYRVSKNLCSDPVSLPPRRQPGPGLSTL